MSQKKMYSYKHVREHFKDKKILFAHWDSKNKADYSYQNWYFPLKQVFKKVLFFSPREEYFRYGKREMNRRLLEVIKKEKPEYVFLVVIYDEFYLETLEKIKRVSPNTKTINFFSDDDWRFDDFARYYALFFDYSLSAQDKVRLYEQEGIKNTFFSVGVNLHNFKFLNLKKKYDVVFIGRPNYGRPELIKFLIKKGINVNVWGHGWDKYPEFKNIYHGPLNAEDMVKVINQSKINLCFTKNIYGKHQIKGRVFEVAACNSFRLVELSDIYSKYFKKGREIVYFRDNQELIKKIQYYLRHENKREKITLNAYKKVLNNYSQEFEVSNFFFETLKNKDSNRKNLDNLKNKSYSIKYLCKKDLKNNNLADELNNFDFVCFSDKKCEIHPYRNLLQAYSLEKSKKDISCCDYYINSKTLGNYLLFKSNLAFEKLNKESFDGLVIPSQIMVSKRYFIKNLSAFKKFFFGDKFSLINNKNTVFVSIPLIQSKEAKTADYETMNLAFQMKFLDILYSLKYQKKISLFSYATYLLLESIKGKSFIYKTLKKALSEMSKKKKAV